MPRHRRRRLRDKSRRAYSLFRRLFKVEWSNWREWLWPSPTPQRDFRPFLQTLEPLQLLAGVWDGGGGDNDWNTATNWDADQLPGAGTSVVIEAAFAGITITSSV